MRRYSRVIAPGIPLVSISASISVSFVALRLLSWAEPSVLPGKASGASAFAGGAFADRRQHHWSDSVQLLPWAHAVPVDEPVTQRRPPRVMGDMPNRGADVASTTSGGCIFPQYPTQTATSSSSEQYY